MKASRGMGIMNKAKMPKSVLRKDADVKTKLYKEGGMAGEKWIQGAVKHPGALRSKLHVKEGQTIPAKKLAKAAKAPGVLGKQARLAQTLKGMKKK